MIARAQHSNFFFIRGSGILFVTVNGNPRRFENLRNIRKIRMMDDVVQSIKTNTAFSKILVAVLCGPTGIFAVIDMEGSNLIFSQHLVKVCNYPVKIVDNIITTVMGMAGIEADTKPVFFATPS